MSDHSRNSSSTNLVDISSNSQVKKVYSKKGRAKRIICIVLSVIFLISGSGLLYYYSVLNSLNFEDFVNNDGTKETTATTETLSSEDLQFEHTNSELMQNSKVLNIMLFGEDNKQGADYGRCDTMIMMSIDNIHKKLKLSSFQRDTYVYIPGYGYNKINASYSTGGPKLAVQTIEANFGIKVDRYAVVDFKSFIKIIDTLGGVDIELDEEEIGYINWQLYKNKQSDTPTTITDPPGVVHLNGQEALWYARNRGASKKESGIGFSGDDWDRTSRQRKLLETIFESMKSASLTEIVSIVSSIGPLVTTNLKKDEITALVARSLTYLTYEVEQYKIPAEGFWYYDDKTVINGRTCSTIKFADLEAQRVDFAEFIYEELVSGETAAE